MKTAEEFWLDNYFSDSISDEDKKLWLECNNQAQITVSIMIAFAKMHVEAALKAADGEVPLPYSHGVLNCYPESNIK